MAAAFFLLFDTERAMRRERVFRDRLDPLDTLTDYELIARYRFPRKVILEVTDLLKEDIQHPTSRSHAISPHIQVCLVDL
jgi:hypothetical protein